MTEVGDATLRLRGETIALAAGRPLLMGILNASPESFYDGARARNLDERLNYAYQLVADGAQIVDIGGQSGVTHRPPVPVAEELRRVVPLVEHLAAHDVVVSVDTWSAEVARGALAAGAAVINDASGLAEPQLAASCAEVGAALVLTHTRAAPKVKAFPRYENVVADVRELLRERLAAARAAGMGEDQLVLDPGPDLAKTPAQTVLVLRGLAELAELGRPLLLAVSRKDFVGAVTGQPPQRRLAGTLAAVAYGVERGAAIVRTHDPAAVADFLAVRETLAGSRELPADLVLEERLRRQDGSS